MLEYPHNALISNYARPLIVDSPGTLILRMPHGTCCCCSCPSRLPISHQWMSATKQNLDYPRCKTKNRWCCKDADSQNGVVTVLLYHLPIIAATTLVMPISDQITIQLPYLQVQKSLTLRWLSFPEWCSDHVAVSCAYTRCQYISYTLQQPSHYSITILTRPKIINTPLKVILSMGQWPCCCLLAYEICQYICYA